MLGSVKGDMDRRYFKQNCYFQRNYFNEIYFKQFGSTLSKLLAAKTTISKTDLLPLFLAKSDLSQI
jgi:hypothetical protein